MQENQEPAPTAESEWTPGVREFSGPGYTAVTIRKGRIVDACPHRHKTRESAQVCAQSMCCIRDGQEVVR